MDQHTTNSLARSSMNYSPRFKTLAYCVAAALAQLAAAGARADTAVGVDTALGNTLNPPGRSAVPHDLGVDADAMDTVRHSPTGQLYGVPVEERAATQTESGWNYSGGVDVGALGGDADKKNALFRQYKDLKNGPYLNYFEVEAEKPSNANFVQAIGGGLGRDDQFYGVQFGRYNDWRVKTFYSETLHVFTDTYKSLYDGVGTGRLTLPAGIAAGSGATAVTTAGAVATVASGLGLSAVGTGNCSATAPCFRYGNQLFSNGAAALGINGNAGPIVAGTNGVVQTAGTYNGASAVGLNTNTNVSGVSLAINNYLANVEPTELSLVRKKGGISAELKLTDFWKGYAGYTQEKRQGTRPFGMVLRAPADSAVEIAEPIDYTTHDLLAGLQYTDTLNAFNLRLSASLFRNNIDTLSVDSPFLQQFVGALNPSSPALKTATFDLYPDNDAYNLKGEYARQLPDFYKSRFTAVAAVGRNHQNDKLIAPLSGQTPSGTVIGAVNSGYSIASNTANAATMLNTANWNTTAALSQQTANADINTKLLDLGLTLNPVTPLNVKGKVRYYETQRPNTYTAYNPLTGQYGYFGLDGTLNNLVVSGNPAAAGVAGSCLTPGGTPFVPPAGAPACTFPGIAAVGAIGQGSVSNNLVYSLPRDYKQLNYTLSADYDLNRYSSLNASLEREDFRRRFRERDQTWEDKVKIGYVNRGYETATLRASYENDRKRGSDYNFWPNAAEYPTALTGLTYDTILNNIYNCSGLGPTGAAFAPANAALCAAYPAFTALGGYIARYSADTRKFDQADRDQNILNGRLNLMPRQDIDLGVMVQLKDVKYPNSVYGLGTERQNSLNFDLNYQPSTEQSFYGFYSFQDGKKQLMGNAGTGNGAAGNCIMGTASSATAGTMINGAYLNPGNIWSLCAATANPATSSTAAKFTTNDIWSTDSNDRNQVLGVGFQNSFGSFKLSMDYTFARSTTKVSYSYNSQVFASANATAANGGATAANINAANAQSAGNGWEDMRFEQNIFNVNLLVPVSNRMSVHLYDRLELGKVRDWHYDNAMLGASNAGGTPTVLLDAGPQNYRANVVGLFLTYKL
jgi:hypothetical protein